MGTVEVRDADGVAAAVCSLFEEEDWAEALIEALAAKMLQDPFFVPPFRHINSDVHQGLIVYEDELVSIAIGVSAAAQLAAKKNVPRGATSIGFSGQMGVLKFVKAGEAHLSFWEAPRIGHEFSRADAGRCWKTGERAIADGEILVIDGRSQSFIIDRAKSNLVLLQATIKPEQAPLSVEYDSASHEYVGCSAADDSASRIQMIATLLRKLDCAAAVETLEPFLDNPNFYVRWHVMRELLGLDVAAALPHLRRMAAHDPHRDNVSAARWVLDRITTKRAQLREAA